MNTLADRIGGKRRVIGGPFGSNLTQKDYVSDGVPVIRGTNMEHHGRWIGGEFAFVDREKAKTLASNTAHPGDIVVTQRGTLGQVSIIPTTLGYSRYIISQSQMAIAVDGNVADPQYVYYYLRSSAFNAYVANSTIQTGVPHINLGILRDAPAFWPSLPEQRAIATTLGSLDDKIELNRRMNETLEAMTQAIFRDWFVDFGPTRRKLEGASDPVAILGGLVQDADRARALANLFPATLGDDGLPEGWRVGKIEEFMEIFDNRRVPLSARERERRTGPFPYHGATSVMGYVDDFLFDETLLLVGEDGSVEQPNGKPFTQYVWGKIWVNNHAHVLKGKYISTEQLKIVFDHVDIAPFVTGAVQAKLNQANMKKIPLVVANREIHDAFDEFLPVLFGRIRSGVEQNRTLAATRDLLLPKLMSGEIRLSEAEDLVEAAQ